MKQKSSERFFLQRATNLLVKVLLFFLLILPAFVWCESAYWTCEGCSGLSKEQISLTIDGKKTSITEFLTAEAGNSHSAMRRKLVILMDVEFSSLEELAHARDLAKTILQKAEPQDLSFIGVISRSGLELLTMPSTDRKRSIEALQSVEKKTANEKEKKGEDPRGGLVAGFADLALQLSVLQGPKTVVLFSPGFSTEGLKAYEPSDESPPELVMEEVDEEERMELQMERTDKKESGTRYDLSKIPELLAGSGSRVNVIGKNENDFYRSLVTKTGGKLLKENVEENLDQLPGLSGSFCVVGWNGSSEKEFKKTHELRIEGGSKTIAESPWIAPRNLDVLTSAERRLKGWEGIYKDSGSGEPFEFLADSILQQDELRIPIFVEIPGKHILNNDSRQLSMELHGFVIGPAGTINDSFSFPVRLDLKNKKLKERIERSGLKMWNVLSSKNEKVNVRWVILDLTSNRVVTHSETLEPQTQTLTLSRPFFPDLNLDWVLWPAPNSLNEREGKEIRYPYTAGADFFFPDLSPAFLKNDGAVLYMRIYNKPSDSKNPPIAFKLSDESKKVYSVDQFQLLQKPVALDNNGLELFWKIASFPASSQGSCRLQVQIQDLNSQTTITRDLPLRLQ